MDLKQEISEIPRALSETLEKGRPEYEALVRKTRWGDGPVFVITTSPSSHGGLVATYAFEWLLGWPVVACTSEAFRAYALGAVRPHSVLLVVAPSLEGEELLEVARQARSRGAQVLALTGNSSGALAQTADGVFLIRPGGETPRGVKSLVCAHAALGYLGLTLARVLKRHHPEFDLLEEEFQKLPSTVEWALGRIPDAVRSLAAEIDSSPEILSVGAGFYHSVALEWARLVRALAAKRAQGYDPCEISGAGLGPVDPKAAWVFLSGSKCRLKKQVHRAACEVRKAGVKVVALTDPNDRELAAHATLAVFLPALTEMVGSTVALAILASAAERVARRDARPADRSTLQPRRGNLPLG